MAAIACIGTGIYCFKKELLKDRLTKDEKLHDHLDKLLQIYQWCVKTGPNATHDEMVIKLLKTIAPYIPNTNDLMPWGISKNLNETFMDVLSQPLHRVRFVMIEDKSSSRFPSFFLPTIKEESVALPSQMKPLYSSFNQTRSEAMLKLYGKRITDTSSEQKEASLVHRLA